MTIKSRTLRALLPALILASAPIIARADAGIYPIFSNDPAQAGNFADAVLFGEGVAFFSVGSDGYTADSIRWYQNAEFSTIASFTTAHPADPSRRFSGFYQLASEAANLYFVANSNAAFSGRYGLFRYDGSQISALVPDSGTLAPSSSFTGISGLQAASGVVAFQVNQGAYRAYYLIRGENPPALIADSNTQVPEDSGSLLELPTNGLSLSPNGEHVVLRLKTGPAPSVGQPERYTIYRYSAGGGLTAVLRIGDSLAAGLTVHALPLQPVVLDDGSILAYAQTMPQGITVAIVHPDNALGRIQEAVNSSGQTVRLSYLNPITDGTHVYGTYSLYQGNAFLSTTPARFDVTGSFVALTELPLNHSGQAWGSDGQVSFLDADARGFLARLSGSAGGYAVFTDIPEIGSVVPAGSSSPWAATEDFAGWRYSQTLGWLVDSQFPFVFTYKFNGWVYLAEGASLQGFYLFSFSDNLWYWSSESMSGWFFRFAGAESQWTLPGQ